MIRTVFVDPAQQGKGIGRKLMAAIERLAQERGASELRVPSSLTAQGFYRQLGFTLLREVIEGEERTLVMVRRLSE